MEQKVIRIENEDYQVLDEFFRQDRPVFMVCDSSMQFLKIRHYFDHMDNIVSFSDFTPNPLYESVVKGVEAFHASKADTIFAIGGGSALDVAKCIKLYSNMDPTENYLKQEIVPNDIRLIAMPTTAGTGSEATRFAVIYYEGVKQSVTSESCIPSIVIMDPSVLKTLPEYQKKVTMMDALCHATESWWSVNSTEESRKYSEQGVRMVLKYMEGYLNNTDEGNAGMMEAAHIAGQAINLAQTTAGHAMSYKLSSLYHVAHGHSVSLCVSALLPYTIQNTGRCIDARGKEYLEDMLKQIAEAYGCSDVKELPDVFNEIVFGRLGLNVPAVSDPEDYRILSSSVNPVRLKNYPVQLDEETIDNLYHKIVREA